MWGPIIGMWLESHKAKRTCAANETGTVEYVGISSIVQRESGTIHYMECSKCGHSYEHVNGDYEFCPRCGRPRGDVEE